MRLDDIGDLPLILPSGAHGLRAVLNAAAARNQRPLNVVAKSTGWRC
jgi:LysR family tcuABC transcriptional regulator